MSDSSSYQIGERDFSPSSAPKSDYQDARTLSYVVAKVADHAQVDGVHPHRLQHHVGYLMNERGGITTVKRQLGHRAIAFNVAYCQRTDDKACQLSGEEGEIRDVD